MLSFDIPTTDASPVINITSTITITESSHKEEEEKESYGSSTTCLFMNIYDYRPKTRYISSDTYYILDHIALYPKDRLLEIIFSNHYHRSNYMRFRLRDDKSVESAKQMKDRIKHFALAGRTRNIVPFEDLRPEIRFELTIEPEGTTMPVSRTERLPNIRVGITDTVDKSNTWYLFGMNAGVEIDR